MVGKHVINIIKVISFFILWSFAICIPLNLWENPSFIGNDASRLRLHWELSPFIMTIIVSIIYMKLVERRNNITFRISKRPILDIILGILLGGEWILLVVGIAVKLDILHLGESNPIPNLFIWIVAIFFNVAMQEIMVRGYMFSLLKREYNVSLAVIVTSVIFTAMHGGAFEAGAIAVLNVFTTSLLLSVLLILSNGLLLPILMHFMWNMLGSLLGIVSLASDYPSLYTSTLSGNNILSGGNAGIEGSIIVLIINVLIIFGLFIYLKNKESSL